MNAVRRVAAAAAAVAGLSGVVVPSASAATVACGDVLTRSTTLTRELICPSPDEPALTIGASGITLDLAGFKVSSVHAPGTIVNPGHERVTIRNGEVQGEVFAVVLTAGADRNRLSHLEGATAGSAFIRATGTHRLVVEDIFNASTIEGHVVVIENSSFATVRRVNTFDGILLQNTSDSVVTHNNIVTSNTGAIMVSGDRNRIRNNSTRTFMNLRGRDNEFTGNEHVGDFMGLAIFDAVNTVVRGNSFTDTFGPGLRVDASAVGTVVKNNVANGNLRDGIRIEAPGTVVKGNRANGNGGWGIFAVPGVVDGGGNRADGNALGDCFGITCR